MSGKVGLDMRTLIVEDDIVSGKVLQEYLSGCSDCLIASDGLEGIREFADALNNKKPFDLVLLDVMMPNMDGHEVLQKIREIEEDRNICGLDGVKVIMVTALGDSESIFQSFREGCEAYIVKPVRKQTLTTEMTKLGLLCTN
jgi:two-component system chemotaxis response regulator CheY